MSPRRANWYWDEIDSEEQEEEIPRMRDLRLSVRSLLREYEDDWESVPDLELGAMDLSSSTGPQGQGDRGSRCWGLDVMSDIFKTFGMEYENRLWNEIHTPRGSLIGEAKKTIRILDPEQREEELHEPSQPEHLANTPHILVVTPASLSESQQDSQQESYLESHRPLDFDPADEKRLFYQDPLPEEKVHQGQPKKYYNYPLSPPESIEDTNPIPQSPKSPIRFPSHRLPTPPTSPESMFAKPRLSKERDPSPPPHPLDLRCPHCGPIAHEQIKSTKEHTSLFGAFKKRFQRQTITPKLRLPSRETSLKSPRIPKSIPPTPRIIPTPQIMTQTLDNGFTASSRDDLLKGPTLKINRLSDISLPLSPEEKEEIDRKRATNSIAPDDFDLVLRLGTFPRESMASRTDNYSFHASELEQLDLPPVPMIDPGYLKSPSGVSFAVPSPTASQFREPSIRSVKKIKRRTNRKFRRNRHKEDTPLKTMLSEENLAKLNKLMGTSPTPPLPSPISLVESPILPPNSTHRITSTSTYAPTEATLSPTFSIPVAPIPTAARKRLLPSLTDQFPIAQTTALGLKGGRVGVVQMGSASKANKILGDMVLIVPDQGTRKRRTHRAPSARSMRKAEKLRGEKLVVEREQDDGKEVIRPKSRGAVWIV